jgi:hypothetical protein
LFFRETRFGLEYSNSGQIFEIQQVTTTINGKGWVAIVAIYDVF